MSLETRNGREGGLVDTLNNAIRDNPLAAGLIGAGVCWMLFSKVKPPALGGITEAVKSAADFSGRCGERWRQLRRLRCGEGELTHCGGCRPGQRGCK